MIRLASVENCTGCQACYNACTHQALSMETDEESFVQPVINIVRCIECHACERACPVISPIRVEKHRSPKAYAVWSNPDRTMSSSGGAFSAFARLFLCKNGVVFGAAFDENLRLHHVEIDNCEDLQALRGSKYVQSDIGDTYRSVKNYLRQGRYVLFCGTPCQIAGLKGFLHKNYDNLLLLDLVCHGVPSDDLWQSYISKLSTHFAGIAPDGYEFRRRNGWGFAPSVSLGDKFHMLFGKDALYMEAFDKNALFRKCCYNCQYATPHRIGDCSLADFWGLGRQGIPFKHDMMKGVSLVLVNNEKGAKALSELNNCFIEQRPLEEALAQNANLNHPSIMNSQREEIIKAFLDPSLSLDKIDKQFHLVDRSFKAIAKKYATRWHLFETVKRMYNLIMTKQ